MSEEFLCQGADPARSSAVPHEYDPDFEPHVRWQNAAEFYQGPIVVDDIVYVLVGGPIDQDGYDNTLVGYDLQNGQGVCRIEVPDDHYCAELVSDGRLVYVYTERMVSAVNPQAERIQWTCDICEDLEYSGSAVAADGSVYATSITENMVGQTLGGGVWNHNVVDIDPADGTSRTYRAREAESETQPSIASSTFLVHSNGLLFFVLDDTLIAVDPGSTDRVKWQQQVPDSEDAFRCQYDRRGIAADESGVYLAPSKVDAGREEVTGETRIGGDSLQASVTAYDHQTGTVQWRTPLSKSGVRRIATANDVVVAYESGSIIALDAVDGSRRWEYHDAASRPIIAGGTVYANHDTEGVVGLSIETGEETHRYDIDDGFASGAPLKDAVVVTGDGTLGCVELEPVATSGTDRTADSSDTQQISEGSNCPGCGETVDPQMQFCPGCGTELGTGQSCSSCGETLTGDEAFCPSCGTEVASDSTCPSCGDELAGDEAFCPSCGTDVRDR